MVVKRDGVRCAREAGVDGRCRLHDSIHRRPRRANLLAEGIHRWEQGALLTEIVGDWWRQWWQTGTLLRTMYLSLRRGLAIHVGDLMILQDPMWFDREHIVYDIVLQTDHTAENTLRIMWGDVAADEILNRIAENPVNADHIFAVQQAVAEGAYDHREFPLAEPLPPPRDPNNVLADFTADAQNVHTTVVSEQLNRGMEKLLAQEVPASRDTLAELRANDHDWIASVLHLNNRSVRTTVNDVSSWYKKRLCRTAGDFLYRKCLDGLTTLILASPHKDDLLVRFWEEARDATGMCCEGHLARLTNVLVGYDEDVPAPVSAGEILQQKMSAIAALDVRVEEKVGQAWAVFLELNIPMEERMAWLEAL